MHPRCDQYVPSNSLFHTCTGGQIEAFRFFHLTLKQAKRVIDQPQEIFLPLAQQPLQAL